MTVNRPLCILATFAFGLLALAACQSSTEPNKNDSGPITVVASWGMPRSSRLPDSISWKAPKDSGSRKGSCNTTTFACSDTFRLSKPLGQDSVALQLWTLGIRTYILYFGEKESPTSLGMKRSFHCDQLDTLLLSRFHALTASQQASFSALGQGASGLVAYYASLLLAGDTSFVGKALPVGMRRDSVEKDLVYLAAKQGWTIEQFLAKAPLPGLDSAKSLQQVKLLIKAGIFHADDSAAFFPPYPVRVNTPIAVKSPLTAGGSPVSIGGVFAWTKGQNIKAPVIQVRTGKAGDAAYFTTPTKLFSSADTIWSLEGNLSLQASSAATAGIDTLVITISDDAGHSATSWTTFQVVSSAVAPTLSPNGGTFYSAQKVAVASASADSLQISTDSVVWTRYEAAIPVASSTKLHARAFKGGAVSPVASATFVIEAVPLPKIVPNGGSFYGTDTVVVEASGADSIQISTDSSIWAKYTTRIVMTSSGKLHARAFKGGVASAVVSASFTASSVPVPTIVPNGGTFYAAPTVAVTGPVGTDSLQISTDSAVWTRYTQPVVMGASGKLHARSFAGGAPSPVVSADFILKTVPLPTISPNGGTFYATQNATVTATEADSIQISTDSATWTRYTTGVSVLGSQKLYARAFKGGVASSVVSASFVLGTVPVPSITPNGGTFYGSTSVTVAAAGADSLQISTDSATWTKYSAALVLTATTKLHARAFKGGAASSVVSASFALGTVPVPSITPNGGSFYGSTSVTVAASGADSLQISTDSATWTKYSAALVLSTTTKLHARAFKGGAVSSVASASFTSSAIPVPTLTPNGGTFYSAPSVAITAPAGTDSIQTSRDSLVWTKYTQAISVSGSSKLYARSFAGGVASPVVSASFVIATVPVPVFAPNGGVVSTKQDITVSATGADSLQTSLDGTTNWTLYAGALRAATNRTLYARAFKGGVASATVSVDFAVPPLPVITPNGGAFTAAKTVAITATAGTIEDSLSTGTTWAPYTSALSVGQNVKIFARTVLDGVVSEVVQADFAFPPRIIDTVSKDTGTVARVTLLAPGSDNIWATSDHLTWTKLRSGDSYSMTSSGYLFAYAVTGKTTSATDSLEVKLYQRSPSISPAGGVFPFAQTVTITPSLSGAEIYYTTDGSEPASSVTGTTFKYSAPFVVGASKTVKAIAVKPGFVTSLARSDSFAIADTTTYGYPWQTGITYGAFQDSRDHQVYRTVAIGTQTWMAQNLNYAGVNQTIGVCYGEKPDSCKKYGRLYSLADMNGGQYSNATTHRGEKGLCPTGWHVASDSEWTTLQVKVSGPEACGHGCGWDGKMLMTTGWLNWDAESVLGTDTYGFRALPGGLYSGGSFSGATNLGGLTQWWAATEFSVGYIRTRKMSAFYVLNSSAGEEEKSSLRCIKD